MCKSVDGNVEAERRRLADLRMGRPAWTGGNNFGHLLIAAANHDLLALLDLVKQTRKVSLGLMDGDGHAEK